MLAKGLLSFYEPPLLAVKSDLNDLIEKQTTICDGLKKEKEKLNEAIENVEIKDMVRISIKSVLILILLFTSDAKTNNLQG